MNILILPQLTFSKCISASHINKYFLLLFTNDNKQKNMLKVESTELQLTVHQGLTTNGLLITYQLRIIYLVISSESLGIQLFKCRWLSVTWCRALVVQCLSQSSFLILLPAVCQLIFVEQIIFSRIPAECRMNT